MDDNALYIRIWRCAAFVLVVLILTVGGCTANRQYQTRVLVEEKGVNPLDASCTMETGAAATPVCVIRAMVAPK